MKQALAPFRNMASMDQHNSLFNQLEAHRPENLSLQRKVDVTFGQFRVYEISSHQRQLRCEKKQKTISKLRKEANKTDAGFVSIAEVLDEDRECLRTLLEQLQLQLYTATMLNLEMECREKATKLEETLNLYEHALVPQEAPWIQ